MLTLLISSLSALATFFAVKLWLGSVAAYFPAVVMFVVAWILIGRRLGRKVQEVSKQVEKHVVAGRTDQAVKQLESLRQLRWWQFFLARSIDGEIGVLLYAQRKDFDRAKPYLERAMANNWRARAMLGAHLFRRKQYDEMAKVFEAAVKGYKKAGLLWSTYAWCEWKRGQRDRAIDILLRGEKRVPGDEHLKRNLQALQNLKKMKMNGYAGDWWALHLEAPPVMRPDGGNVPRWMGGGRRAHR